MTPGKTRPKLVSVAQVKRTLAYTLGDIVSVLIEAAVEEALARRKQRKGLGAKRKFGAEQ